MARCTVASENQFGHFFRESREALGVKLREFCRKNGFDAGNLSKMERGLVPPPTSSESLEIYAAALKLVCGTERWTRFHELAAAETGRIPTELMKGEDVAGRLPKLFRELRSGPGHRNWVSARHLEDWAGRIEARSMLPQLIRRLVAASGRGVSKVEFPAFEQTQRPGPDGFVEAGEGDAFVPAGVSIWEMGVDKDPKAKAEGDFEKRRAEKLGFEKRKVTYVAVTPRKWQGKGDWAKTKAKLKAWKEIRVYDSASLEEWLERAPGVDVWLAERLGIKPLGLVSIDEYWKNLESLTDPGLGVGVFLSSRQKEAEELKSWLKGPPGVLAIETRSPGEAIDFVVAAHVGPNDRDSFSARTLVVENLEAWRSITRSEPGLTLLPHPRLALEPEIIAEAVRKGHRVVVYGERGRAGDVTEIKLPRVYRYDLQKALEEAGLGSIQADDMARRAGGSLTVLKRLMARFPAATRPEWSKAPHDKNLVPLLLAGSWEDTWDGDRAALEELSGRPFSEVLVTAERWLGQPDPPVTRVLSRWSLVSRDDSLFLLGAAIGKESLDRFERVVLKVLMEEDPSYELPPDKRWQASMFRKVSSHSYALRTALAETLALLGARAEQLDIALNAQGLADRVVEKLLKGGDWHRWASLSPQLPLLAEAAPEQFLDLADKDVQSDESSLVGLFAQEVDSFFSSSPHTGLLWALEKLAWDRKHLPRVTLILAMLDERAPMGRLGNRPGRSLQEIFLPWYPQTATSLEDRIGVLKLLARRQPRAAWKLSISLLPQMHQVSMPISRPLWRDWTLSWREGATNLDVWRHATATGDLLLGLAGQDVGRWKDLIEHFESLAQPCQDKFFEKLGVIAAAGLGDQERRTLGEAVREKLGRHRRFSDAGWALPEEILCRFDPLVISLEPAELVARHAWLFGPYWSVRERIPKEGKAVEDLRAAALRQILESEQLPGILALAANAEAPHEVGDALARIEDRELDEEILPALIDSDDAKIRELARGYALRKFLLQGWPWVEGLKPGGWPADAAWQFATWLPFERKTWDFVASLGAEAEAGYWKLGELSRYANEPDDLRFATSMLVTYGRPLVACHLISHATEMLSCRDVKLVLDAIDALSRTPAAESQKSLLGRSHYQFQRLFEFLQRCAETKAAPDDEERLARLEWQFLSFLNGYPARPRTLHRLLGTKPEFLLELIATIFRRDDEPKDEGRVLSEEEQARAHNAYSLLMSWQTVPGSRPDGTVDEDALISWAEEVRSLAKERGYSKITDSKIGSVLAWDRVELEKPWPSLPVRDLLEEIGTEELFSGWEVGIFNKRGVVSKSLREGGAQEWKLMELYRRYAEACAIEWPKVAASLRRVAMNYQREAEREDAETRLDV